jgi:hypothetical protein
MYRQSFAGFLTGLLLLAIVAAPRPGAARPAITRTLDIQQTDRVTSLSFLQQTDPRVTFVLETSGKPYRNLTGYTGKFYYGTSLTAAAFATITSTNVNTAAGSITFDLSASDTNTNGTFKAVLLIEDESAKTFYYGTMDLSIIETTITTGADALALGNTVNWTGTTFTNTTTAGPYLAGSNITFRASGTNGQYFIDGSAGGGGGGTDTALDNRTATNNVNMGGFNISNVTNLQFAGGTGTQGTLSWNTDEDTLDLIEGNSTLQLGQEIHYHVRNNSGAEIADGSVVYATGSLGASGRLTVNKFLADGNTDVIYMLGVATEDIANDADGKVTSFGKVRGIDTSAYSAGDVLYPSATVAGGFTTNAPAAPNVASAIAFVINSHASTGTISVRVHPEDANENAGTVTSVAISGANGLTVAGSPITTNGTIALTVNAADLRTHLNVENGADVTDEANVTDALDGATLTAATVAAADKVLIQDADGADALKTVTAQSIADLAAGGGTTPPREYNLPAIGAPPYGGVSGSESMAEQTVFTTNSLSIVTLNFDDATEEIIGPYLLAMPNNLDTNTDFSVTFYSWGDAAGDVKVALGYELGGLSTPTWVTNTVTVTTNYADFGQDTFTLDVNPADREHSRWYIKRVAADSGDTSAGDWNLVNTLLEVPRE